MQPVARVEHAPWCNHAPLTQLWAAYEAAGGACLIVGGAVRDTLLGREVQEWDMAGTLTPDATMAALEDAGFKVIPTGIAHGTVTVVLSDKRTIEITTLREDVTTDGRHAQVQFGTDWHADASRRDLTVNALYADIVGAVYDPLGTGAEDIAACNLRFIGDAWQRVREDYLRLLRYVRFAAQLDWRMNAETWHAITQEKHGLAQLSGERVWGEIKKLLLGQAAIEALLAMQTAQLWEVLGLEAMPIDHAAWQRLMADEHQHHAPCLWSRLALLVLAEHTGEWSKVLRWSRVETRTMSRLVSQTIHTEAALLLCRMNDGDEMACAALLASSAPAELWEVMNKPMPVFPINGVDVQECLHISGKEVGEWLDRAKQHWAACSGKLSKPELMAWLKAQQTA